MRNISSEKQTKRTTTKEHTPTTKKPQHSSTLKGHQSGILSERKITPLFRKRNFMIAIYQGLHSRHASKSCLAEVTRWAVQKCFPLPYIQGKLHSFKVIIMNIPTIMKFQHLLLELVFWIAILKHKIFSIYKISIV